MAHRPELDGLRSVAVYLVVLFHSEVARFRGGFIGVDVFFVLSGYLVTQTLLHRSGPTGSFDLRDFYARRVRRLLPAASINLVATALVFRWLASPAEAREAASSIRAAALYVSNWWFIRQDADYFGVAIDASPVLHYWSLSVEEQFYVLWPLLLGALLWAVNRWAEGQRRVVALAVIAGAAASLGAAVWMERTDPIRAYYGTDTRAYQLLAGAALALLPGLVARIGRAPGSQIAVPAVAVGSLVALPAVASSMLGISPVRRGIAATVLTVLLLAALSASSGRDPARRLLSTRPLVFLGRISYGTYLWHWLVVKVAMGRLELGAGATFVVTTVVASGIAALSYELVERPIREQRVLARRRGGVLVCGLALTVAVAVGAPRILETTPTVSAVSSAPAPTGTPISIDLDEATAASRSVAVRCPIDSGDLCVLHHGSGQRVLIVGDSHGLVLAPAFAEIAQNHDLDLAAAFGRYCPWLPGIAYQWPDPDRCYRFQDRTFDQLVPDFDPDLVILVHKGFDDPVNPLGLLESGHGSIPPGPDRDAAVADRVHSVVDQLLGEGRRVLLVEPVPVPSPTDSVRDCLSGATYLEECRRVAAVGPTPVEQVMRELDAAHDDVWAFDLDPLACPYLPICDPIVDGRLVSSDGTHLTPYFAVGIAGVIEQFLVDNSVLTD